MFPKIRICVFAPSSYKESVLLLVRGMIDLATHLHFGEFAPFLCFASWKEFDSERFIVRKIYACTYLPLDTKEDFPPELFVRITLFPSEGHLGTFLFTR